MVLPCPCCWFSGLAQEAIQAGRLLWKVRPKHHKLLGFVRKWSCDITGQVRPPCPRQLPTNGTARIEHVHGRGHGGEDQSAVCAQPPERVGLPSFATLLSVCLLQVAKVIDRVMPYGVPVKSLWQKAAVQTPKIGVGSCVRKVGPKSIPCTNRISKIQKAYLWWTWFVCILFLLVLVFHISFHVYNVKVIVIAVRCPALLLEVA